MINGLSLFSNVGIAETYLEEVGINISVANELLPERAKFYQHLYPNCEMVQGDITDDKIFEDVINKAIERDVQFIIATPPCQGMSPAGLKKALDKRNHLIIWAIEAIKRIRPQYVILENVMQQLKTTIIQNKKKVMIPDYIESELGAHYFINRNKVIDSKFYGIPQQRKRAIFLLARKDTNKVWEFPVQDQQIVTLQDVIGDLPSLDPEIKEVSERHHFPDYEEKRARGLAVSKWHYPPQHVWRNIEVMMHTPEGQSARKNPVFFPKKKDGTMVGGALRTYMRMEWKRPAPTVTAYNRTISSFQNVHPGRPAEKDGIYSDARVLSIFELMRITTLPDNWDIPEWATETLIRTVIGEGIPPLLIKRLVGELKINISKKD